MMEAVRTSETSVDNHFTWQYNPEDSSEHHTRCHENLKSHKKDSVVLWVSSCNSNTVQKPILLFLTKKAVTWKHFY
jgi:hypothetical protein